MQPTPKANVAIDTETDSLTACTARLVGISMAIEPGKACYIPVSHIDPNTVASDGGFSFNAVQAPKQIKLPLIIKALQNLLVDPAVLKSPII